MNIFADFHHGCLFYSLQLLFEYRLKCNLYRPIGLDWYHQGYWKIYPHINTANQFLSLDQTINPPKDVYNNLISDYAVVNKNYIIDNNIYYVTDPTKDIVQKAVTLDQFKDMTFDVIISSIPQHIELFNKLIQQYQPKAKHIFQIGNAWSMPGTVKNILASIKSTGYPSGLNVCFYHQEFDLDMFNYELPTIRDKIYSYIHYMRNKPLMMQYNGLLSQYEFKSFGAGMEDHIFKTKDIAKQMKQSSFTWHYKPEGDGYGYSLHHTYACGRPAIIWGKFYENTLAEKLLKDGITCIDISKHTLGENIELIKKYSQPEEHDKMCENAYKRFKNTVNFDEDFQRIVKFLENLL